MTTERKKKAKDISIITALALALAQGGYQQFIKEPADITDKVKAEVAVQVEPACQRLVLLEKSDAVQNVQIIGLTSSVTSVGIKQDKIFDMVYELKHN